VLITDTYRELNARLHKDRPDYGTSGQRYAHIVRYLCERFDTRDVLDYGCGKRTLERALGFSIANYDPCIEGLDKSPEEHDIVACTDVLEHIEPDCLDEVLKDIRRCTKKSAFLLIATRPAVKTLADGRNAHLIQEGQGWWKERLVARGFEIGNVIPGTGEFGVICGHG